MAYGEMVEKAKVLANEDKLVTFGIKPLFPETGFGYIEVDASDGNTVKTFYEKPDLGMATIYLEAGNYYWNSGMFCFKAGIFLEEFKKYSLDIHKACQKAYVNAALGETIRIKKSDMVSIPDNSIDYAVMERSKKVAVVPSDIEWSDVGNFDTLYDELPKDEDGNTISDKHIAINSKNNFIYGEDRIIATVDVNDIIVVDTGDALLISKKSSSQKVKRVVEEVRKNSELYNIHLTTHRPWVHILF